jgi:large subunit ribosomal protein L6
VGEGSVRVKGPEGELRQPLPPGIRAELKDGELHMLRASDEKRDRAFHGLARSLVANAVQGVSKKYERKLEIVGIGYRATPGKGAVTFNLGYSHAIEFPIPPGVEVTVDKQTSITVRGADKELVGRVAAEIRDLKRPDVYKGKGVRYEGERVRQKVGKTGA